MRAGKVQEGDLATGLCNMAETELDSLRAT